MVLFVWPQVAWTSDSSLYHKLVWSCVSRQRRWGLRRKLCRNPLSDKRAALATLSKLSFGLLRPQTPPPAPPKPTQRSSSSLSRGVGRARRSSLCYSGDLFDTALNALVLTAVIVTFLVASLTTELNVRTLFWVPFALFVGAFQVLVGVQTEACLFFSLPPRCPEHAHAPFRRAPST